MAATWRKIWRRFTQAFLWRLVYLIIALFSHIFFSFRCHYELSPDEISGPSLILANHQSFLDPFFALHALRPLKLRFVVGEFLMRQKFLKNILEKAKVIPICQFWPDPVAVRQILRALKQGETVLIYPEAQRSIDGGSLPFDTGVLRLAQKAKANVLCFKTKGAYLAWPRWRQGVFSRQAVEAELCLLQRAEDWTPQSLLTLETKVRTSLYLEESLEARKAKGSTPFAKDVKRKSKQLSEHRRLHLILHRCPLCQSPESLVASSQALRCQNCGASFSFDATLVLKNVSFPIPSGQDSEQHTLPQDVRAWHCWQITREDLLLSSSGPYPVKVLRTDRKKIFPRVRREEVRAWQVSDKNKILNTHLETAQLYLNPAGLRLEFAGGECFDYKFKKQQLFSFSQGFFFQLSHGEEIWRIFPKNPYLVIRLIDGLLARRTSENSQLLCG